MGALQRLRARLTRLPAPLLACAHAVRQLKGTLGKHDSINRTWARHSNHTSQINYALTVKPATTPSVGVFLSKINGRPVANENRVFSQAGCKVT